MKGIKYIFKGYTKQDVHEFMNAVEVARSAVDRPSLESKLNRLWGFLYHMNDVMNGEQLK